MNPNIVLQQPRVIVEINYMPAVSIILPIRSLITLKSTLEDRVKLIMKKTEQRLLALYSEEKAVPVIRKLKNLIRTLKYDTHKKGIAIFVSPVLEQVYYLEAEVEEKIAIDEFFEIRDEVFRKNTNYIE